MKISKIFAGMSALAIAAAASSVSASAIADNTFVNATGTWTYTYSGSQIATAVSEGGMEFGSATNEETGVTTYTLGGNIQVGHVKNAKVTMQVTSTSNNIVNGFNEDGTVITGNSDYLYTVQSSWNADADSDNTKSPIKYNEEESKYGATELNNWDSGPTKYNGQWAQCMLTDDNLDAITITVTVVADENSTWEYHNYDDSKSEDDNSYEVFRMFGSPSTIYEKIANNVINDQVSDDESSADDTSSSADSTSSKDSSSKSSSTSSTTSTDSASTGTSSGSSTTTTSKSSTGTSTTTTSKSSSGSSTTTTTSSASGTAESDNTANAESGAAEGVGLAIAALAGVAVVVSRRK